MRSTRRASKHGRDERPSAESSLALPSERRGLPDWESFPVGDRHRVVSAILQTARRQVETQPTSSLSRT